MENAQAADGETGSLCRGCVIHTIFGKQYNDGTPLGEYETRLEGEHFYRIHKTSLVHLKYVDSIFPWTGNGFALRVRGESMLNAGILPGDLVVVHQQQEARNGEIIVALIEDEATVKRLKRKDGHVWLMPENEAYSPIDGTHASILGKVSAVIRTY